MGARLSTRALARKGEERTHRREEALRILRDWGGPAPPIACILSIRELASLAKDGLTEFVGRDNLGDSRYRLTAAGEEAARQL